MSQQLQNGKQQFFDGNGSPLANGSVTFYIPGTTTPVDTWQDSALSVLNTNPVVLDGNGMAVIWGESTALYRQIVKDASGITYWDQVIGMSADAGATRPIPTSIGQQYFDTSLGIPVWCSSLSPITWVNSAGGVVA